MVRSVKVLTALCRRYNREAVVVGTVNYDILFWRWQDAFIAILNVTLPELPLLYALRTDIATDYIKRDIWQREMF